MTTERVILVDERDRAVGTAEKLSAHAEGRLHRAFSIFVFDGAGRLLLQRRARTKYHSGGLWSNTCCGHPRPEETTEAAAHRRLREEMNFDCELREAFGFVYRAELDGRLVEHEYDHIFVGDYEGDPEPDPSEVEEWRRLSMDELRGEVRARPGEFTYWLRAAILMREWERVEHAKAGGRVTERRRREMTNGKAKTPPPQFAVGDRVCWNSGGRKAVGRVVRVATESGCIRDFVYEASPVSPRYIVETDDGRPAAHRADALERA